MIPYSRQKVDSLDIKKVIKVLKSDYLTTGPNVKIFEKNITRFLRVKYSVCVSSASAALHIACISLGIKKNDIVWTTPITFVSTASAILHCGGKVDLVDIDEDTFNISLTSLKKKLINAKKINKLPKLLMPVHLGGNPCDMKAIYILSKKYNFKILEDASHAFGSKIERESIGSCKYSDIAVFSFHPVKIITTGEGGVAVTKDKKLYNKMKSLREHGIVREKSKLKKKSGPWYYEQQSLGFNYRMSDINAGLGISQLKKTKKFILERNKIIEIYKKKLNNKKIKFQLIKKENFSTYHLFIVLFPKKIHRAVFTYLRKKNFFVNIHYIPLFMHPIYRNLFNKKKYPNAINYYERAISLPVYVGLKKNLQFKLINIINKFL